MSVKAKQFHLIEDLDIAAIVFAAVERIEAFAARVSGIYRLWAQRSHDRRMLAGMNARMLDDIGLTQAQVDREVSKFFWQK